jgi:hypothetical protein
MQTSTNEQDEPRRRMDEGEKVSEPRNISNLLNFSNVYNYRITVQRHNFTRYQLSYTGVGEKVGVWGMEICVEYGDICVCMRECMEKKGNVSKN